jgi:hypothetical protein
VSSGQAAVLGFSSGQVCLSNYQAREVHPAQITPTPQAQQVDHVPRSVTLLLQWSTAPSLEQRQESRLHFTFTRPHAQRLEEWFGDQPLLGLAYVLLRLCLDDRLIN